MIQRAQDAPRRGLEPPHATGAGLALFAAAVAARAGVAWLAGSSAPVDPRVPMAAAHLLAGHGLSLGPLAAPTPTAALAPLSPWLLSQALGGSHSHPLTLAAGAILAGALAAPAASWLTAGLFGPTAGRVVGWSVALSPFLLAGALAFDANVFALAVVLALAAGAAWLRTPRRGRAFGAGLLCGLAALASAPGLLLAPLLLAWSWRPLGLTVPPRERFNQAALVLLGLCVVVAPWTIRNSVVLHRWAPVTAAEANDYPMRRRAATSATRWREVWTLSPGDANPATLATPSASPRSGPDIPRHPLFTFLAVAEIAWLGLAAWGAVRTLSGPRRWYQSLPLLGVLALMLAALTAPDASRARLGFEPLVAQLAALGAVHARRAVYLWQRGLRLVRGGPSR